MIDVERIKQILDPYDTALPWLECDGFSRVASYLLQKEGIAHRAYVGAVRLGGRVRMPYHMWLIVGDGDGTYLIDYRLRMWLGEQAPHGVFADGGDVVYEVVSEVEIRTSPTTFKVLVTPPLAEI